MTATSDIKSHLIFFLCLYIYRRDGGWVSGWVPCRQVPPGHTVTHTGTRPEGLHHFLSLHCPLLHSIRDLIREAPPLNLLYSIVKHQSNLLT